MNKRYIIIPIAMLVMLAASASPVMAVSCGDVNCDDMVAVGDLGLLDLKLSLGATLDSEWAGDVNCDDMVTVGDLGLLDLKLSLGATLNCCDDDNVLEYSVTIIEDYSDSLFLGDLTRGQESYDALVEYIRDNAHWTERFHEVDDSVDEPDFGTSNSGYQGLDGADFHYHFGHGYDDWGTEICLHDWAPGPNIADVRAQDVEYKWDEDNEWTIIHSCVVLDDWEDWKHALKYSHAVMGFETDVYMHEAVINNFLVYAIYGDYTVYDAYYWGTKIGFNDPNIIAVAIFDNEEQKNNDHLWGHGVVMPDEYPDDGDYWYYSWTCED
jgi:hypothetical protein